ncbi:hypothetical protein FRC05_000750 [Tulasnella sp. 425]|nr:hypothetical protein FRC05_000750 [Tulasnella sp. 425]
MSYTPPNARRQQTAPIPTNSGASRYPDSGYLSPAHPSSPPRVDVPYDFGPPIRSAISPRPSNRPPLSVATQEHEYPDVRYLRRSPDTVTAPSRQDSDTTLRYNLANNYIGESRRPEPFYQAEWPTPADPAIQRRPSTGPEPSSSSRYAGSYRPQTASTISTASSSAASSGSSSGRSGIRQPTISTSPGLPSTAEIKKPLEWENIFHPSFVPEVSNFAQDWHFTGLYTSHILFSQNSKLPPSKKVLVYDVEAQKQQQIKVRYDSAGLGPYGKYLLYRYTDEMALYDIVNSRTIKTASLRNLSRWAYNSIGFCLVDDSGKFWRWNFGDKLPPGLIFRLVDRAPRDRLRCLTTRDGAWNAIVATNKDRTQGDIHCYPSNNDESKIFSGVLAAFTQSEVGGQTVTHIAVVKIESEEELSFTIHQLGPPVPGVVHRVETKMPFEAVGGPPSAIFIDHDLGVGVVLATPPGETYHALLFDLRSGTFFMKQSIAKVAEDSWLVDDTGIFRERKGSVVQRLRIVPENLPPRPTMGSPPPAVGTGRSPGMQTRLSPVSPIYGLQGPQSSGSSSVQRKQSLPFSPPSPPSDFYR